MFRVFTGVYVSAKHLLNDGTNWNCLAYPMMVLEVLRCLLCIFPFDVHKANFFGGAVPLYLQSGQK